MKKEKGEEVRIEQRACKRTGKKGRGKQNEDRKRPINIYNKSFSIVHM